LLSSIPTTVKQKAEELLCGFTGSSVKINSFHFASGGCINQGGKLDTSAGDFFIKWNSAENYPNMFAAEAKGLRLLYETHAFRIPAVINFAELTNYQILLLEFIEGESRNANYWQNLGQQLAALHKYSASQFGLDHDNYIGSLTQRNHQHRSWADFFIHERIDPLVRQCIDKGLCPTNRINDFESLYNKLPSIFPDEAPALLHGDLWSGNLISDEKGNPVLIDPAVYFGHREMDIAFTTLFGGFDPAFYNAYKDAFPLLAGFEQRKSVYNIYPLLVHAILFGGGYLNQALDVLKRYK